MIAGIERHLPAQLATLAGFLAPSATFNHQPITDLFNQVPNFYPTGATSIQPRGEQTDSLSQILIKHYEPPHHLFTLSRSPDGPHPNSWLISDISPDSS